MIQSVAYRVLCGSTVLTNVVSLDYSFSQNAVGSATIQTTSPVAFVTPEQQLVIEAGTPELRRVFTGYVDSVDYNVEQGVYVIQARDVLKKALDTFLIQEVKFGIDVEQQRYYYSTYTAAYGGTFTVHEYTSLSALHAAHPETVGNITHEGVKAEAVVQWLLVMCGIDERTSIRVTDSQFFIGDINPVQFHLVSVYDAIQQIVDLLGWWFYADAYGICRFHPRPVPANPVVLPQSLIVQASSTVTNEFLRNYVEVIGASGIRVVERSPSPYLGSTPYRGVLISNEFIDTNEIASYMAQRVLFDLNRLRWKVQIVTLPFSISHTTVLSVPSLLSKPLTIESFSASINASQGYLYTIQAMDALENVFFEDTHSLVADFQVFYLMTIGDPRYVCRLDASASFSLNADIVSWEWEIEHAAGTEYATAQIVHTAFDSAQLATTGVLVRLTVRDAQNRSATTERVITLNDIELPNSTQLYRSLYACFGTMAAASIDGGQTWFTAPIPAVFAAVSHFDELAPDDAPSYALFLTSTGAVYRTTDHLQTYQTVTLPPVSSIAISPSFPWRAYASSQQHLYVSNDGGMSFVQHMSFPSPILQIEPDRTNHEIVYVVCQATSSLPYGGLFFVDVPSKNTANLWDSWNRLYDAPLRYIGGVSQESLIVQWVLSTSGVYAVANGDVHALSLAGIASLTPTLHDAKRAHVVFHTGSYGDLLLEDDSLVFSSNGTHTAFSHTIRDGLAANVVYYATASGVEKSIDGHRTVLPLYTPQSAVFVTYGDLHQAVFSEAKGLVVWAKHLQDVVTEDDFWQHGLERYLYVADTTVESVSSTSPSTGFYRVVRPDIVSDVVVTDADGSTLYGYCEQRSFTEFPASPTYVYPYSGLTVVPFAFRVPDPLTLSGLGLVIPRCSLLTSGYTDPPVIRFVQASTYADQTFLSLWYRQNQSFYHTHAVVTAAQWASYVAWDLVADPREVASSLLPPPSQRSEYDFTQITTVYPSTKTSVALIESDTQQILVHAHDTATTTYTEIAYPSATYNVITKPNPVSYTVVQQRSDGKYLLFTQKVSNPTPLELTVADPWTSGEGVFDWHQSLSFPEVATYEIEVLVTEAPAGSSLFVGRLNELGVDVPLVLNEWVTITVENATGFYWHRRHFFYRYRKVGEIIRSVHASRLATSSVLYVATLHKLFSVDDYGRGEKTLLFTVPEGYEVIPSRSALSVTYNRQEQSDAICLIIRNKNALDSGLIVYRYHKNDPWKYHAWSFSSALLGGIFGVWVLSG